jgi:hypothetical protein
MPIPSPTKNEKEEDYISRCISEIGSEYDAEGQAYAVCKGEWDKPTEMAAVEGKTKHQEDLPNDHDVHHGATSEKAAKAVKPKGIGADEELAEIDIPFEIIGDNEEKILDYLPEPKAHEMENSYLERCIPCLYPKYVDQTTATALCADKLQRKTTVTNLKKQNLSIMKAEKMSPFERKRLEFQVQLLKKELLEKGIRLAEEGGGSYAWEDCIADQTERYGDEETAAKVCGAIKAEYGS